jgi:hypothetical protein
LFPHVPRNQPPRGPEAQRSYHLKRTVEPSPFPQGTSDGWERSEGIRTRVSPQRADRAGASKPQALQGKNHRSHSTPKASQLTVGSSHARDLRIFERYVEDHIPGITAAIEYLLQQFV